MKNGKTWVIIQPESRKGRPKGDERAESEAIKEKHPKQKDRPGEKNKAHAFAQRQRSEERASRRWMVQRDHSKSAKKGEKRRTHPRPNLKKERYKE